MTLLLAIAGLIVSLVLLGAAGGFGAVAIRRTRASEATRGGTAGPGPRPYAAPPGPAQSSGQTPYRGMPSGMPSRPPRALWRPPPSHSDTPEPYGGAYGAAGWITQGVAEPGRRLRSSRGPWVGAAVSGGAGFVALVGAVTMLIVLLLTPAHTLTAPPKAGGLSRDDSAEARQRMELQRRQMQEAGVPNPVAAIYRKPGDQRVVVLFTGGSGRIDDPEGNLRGVLSGVADSFGGGADIPSPHPAGPLEGTVLCVDGLGDQNAAIVACGWADSSTLGMIAASGSDEQGTADLLLDMRADIEQEN